MLSLGLRDKRGIRTEYSHSTNGLESPQVMSLVVRSPSLSPGVICRPARSAFFDERTWTNVTSRSRGNLSAERWNDRASSFVRRSLYSHFIMKSELIPQR